MATSPIEEKFNDFISRVTAIQVANDFNPHISERERDMRNAEMDLEVLLLKKYAEHLVFMRELTTIELLNKYQDLMNVYKVQSSAGQWHELWEKCQDEAQHKKLEIMFEIEQPAWQRKKKLLT